jgi:hypothetical protein
MINDELDFFTVPEPVMSLSNHASVAIFFLGCDEAFEEEYVKRNYH